MGTKSYEVQSGDTLGVIAQENNTTVDEIMGLNKQIQNKNLIMVGQDIVIPTKAEKKKVEVKQIKKDVAKIKAETKDSKPEEVYNQSCRIIHVQKVTGPKEITIGESATYEITQYNRTDLTDAEKKKVKWKVEVYEDCESTVPIRNIDDCSSVSSIFEIENDKLIIKKVPDFWICCISVYPYIESATIAVRQMSITCSCQKEEMLKLKKQYQNIINRGRKLGANWAAKMLEHWMNGSGEDLIITMELLKRYELITDAEDKIREEILTGIKKRVDETTQDGETIYYIAWEEGLTASIASEFFYASGSSNLVGRIKVKINKNSETTSASGVLEYHWADPYDWHLGFDAWIPGVGTIEDADALKYESAGCAKSFGMYSFWHQSFSFEYIVDDTLYFDKETIEWGEIVEGRADISKRGALWEWESNNIKAVKDGNKEYHVGLIKNEKKDSISNTKERRDREARTREDNRRDERRGRR